MHLGTISSSLWLGVGAVDQLPLIRAPKAYNQNKPSLHALPHLLPFVRWLSKWVTYIQQTLWTPSTCTAHSAVFALITDQARIWVCWLWTLTRKRWRCGNIPLLLMQEPTEKFLLRGSRWVCWLNTANWSADNNVLDATGRMGNQVWHKLKHPHFELWPVFELAEWAQRGVSVNVGGTSARRLRAYRCSGPPTVV